MKDGKGIDRSVDRAGECALQGVEWGDLVGAVPANQRAIDWLEQAGYLRLVIERPELYEWTAKARGEGEETATAGSVAEPVQGRVPASLAFDEYDRLVRAEMRRLARGGVMPGPAYWDRAREPRLPSLQAVIERYGFKNAERLANHLGYLPPPSNRRSAEVEF